MEEENKQFAEPETTHPLSGNLTKAFFCMLGVLLFCFPTNALSVELAENVQKRPIKGDFSKVRYLDNHGRRFLARKPSRRYVKAKVLKATYHKERSLFGNWRGRVKGDGRTHLFLRFIQNGKVIARRLIGRVELDNEPRGVLFSYRGSVPKKRKLRWDIVAFSEK